MIVSLGMWDEPLSRNPMRAGGVDYLYCVSKYPTELCRSAFRPRRLRALCRLQRPHHRHRRGHRSRSSRGARIIEKHFTLDKAMYGPDHSGSMTPSELARCAPFAMKPAIAHER